MRKWTDGEWFCWGWGFAVGFAVAVVLVSLLWRLHPQQSEAQPLISISHAKETPMWVPTITPLPTGGCSLSWHLNVEKGKVQ